MMMQEEHEHRRLNHHMNNHVYMSSLETWKSTKTKQTCNFCNFAVLLYLEEHYLFWNLLNNIASFDQEFIYYDNCCHVCQMLILNFGLQKPASPYSYLSRSFFRFGSSKLNLWIAPAFSETWQLEYILENTIRALLHFIKLTLP